MNDYTDRSDMMNLENNENTIVQENPLTENTINSSLENAKTPAATSEVDTQDDSKEAEIIPENEISEDEPDYSENQSKKSTDKKETNSTLRFIYETLEMVAISIAIVILLITFVARYSPVSGESMTYTINEGDSLLVQIAFYEPQKNDIVILQAPNYDLNKPLIKRVIATGGDELFINFNTWEVKVNGVTIDEYYVRYNPYVFDPMNSKPDGSKMEHQNIYNIPGGNYDESSNTFSAIIPEGKIFVMGDNRNNSHDSRSSNVGFVDERCVIGKAIFRLAPLSDMGPLE